MIKLNLSLRSRYYQIELIFRPTILDNVEHWKVFYFDIQLLYFLQCTKEYALGFMESNKVLQLESNKIPIGMIDLENLYDQNSTNKL